jgi:hypothetical protein
MMMSFQKVLLAESVQRWDWHVLMILYVN